MSEAVVTTANSNPTPQVLKREEILRAYFLLVERKARLPLSREERKA